MPNRLISIIKCLLLFGLSIFGVSATFAATVVPNGIFYPITIPSNLLNADITQWTDGGKYNGYMTGTQNFNGVPFNMQTNSSNNNVIWTTSTYVFSVGSATYTNTATLNTSIYGATTVYTLINNAFGNAGSNVGSVTFNASDGTSYSVNLVVGLNVRDHNNGTLPSASYLTPNVLGANTGAHLDMQAFALPASFASKKLTSIVFTSTGSNSTGMPFLAGATVDAAAFPVAYYALDEASWNGASGEVVDSVSGFNATIASLTSTKPNSLSSSPAISGSPGTCRYGNFIRADKTNIVLPSNFPNLGADGQPFSVTAWINTTNNSLGGQRVFIDDETSGGYGLSLADPGPGRLRFYSRGTPSAIVLDTDNVIANNQWYFVVMVADVPNKTKRIYVYNTAGTLLSNVSATWTEASFGFDNGAASIGGETNQSGERSPNFGFSGNIDEVSVYSNALTTDQANTIRQLTHVCSNNASVPSFNCVAVGDTPNAGRLYTQVAANAFNLDVVALKSDGSVETNYVGSGTKNVTLEFVDGSGNTACASRAPINPAVSQTVTFSVADAGRKTVSSTVTKAYRDLRCRITDANETPNKVDCSSDNFAVRPSGLSVTTSNANADSTGTSTTFTPKIKAGANFSLTATANVMGYDGTPVIDASKLSAHTGAVQAGMLSGSFSAANASTSESTGASFSYSEVGYFRFGENGVYDSSFTSVDSGNGDCVAGFVAIGVKYGCSFGNTATTNYFGRFIPDHFAITPSTSMPACNGSFTYYGQDGVSTIFTLTAQNASNQTTQNYTGSFAKLGLTNWSNYNFTSQGSPYSPELSASATSPTGTWANGSAPVTAKHQITRLSAMVPQSPKCANERSICSFSGTRMVIYGANGVYTSGNFTNSVICDNSVFGDPLYGIGKACYLGNLPSPSTVSVLARPTDSDGVTMASTLVSPASLFRYGRLLMPNTYGSELLPLSIPIEAQYWNGTAYQRNQQDSCSSISASSIAMGNYKSNLNACETVIAGGGSMSAGKTTMTLSKPGNGNNGSVDLTVNLNGAAGNTCNSASQTAAISAGLPWFGTTTLSSRATFGLFKTPVIYMRENF